MNFDFCFRSWSVSNSDSQFLLRRQERNDILENQLSEIQHRLQARSNENGKTQGLDAIELQQQISDLRNSLAEVIQQNQDLETTLTQKQLELEQRDRVMREQSKFLKVRDELLSLLKGKQANAANPNENYEDIDEVMHDILLAFFLILLYNKLNPFNPFLIQTMK